MLRTFTLAVLAVAIMSTTASAQVLQPHRALYRVDLAESATSTAIADASGLIGFEWQASCESFSTSQRFFTRFITAEGVASSSDIIFSAEESRDGSSFAFNLADSVNGEVIKHLVGEAVDGEISFTQPAYQRSQLPAGTIFPTEHSARLIASAIAGQQFFETRVFDGGGENEIYDTVARIDGTDRMYLPHPDSDGVTRLAPLTSWFISLSYYEIDDISGAPNYEVSYRMFSNGIVDELFMNYGEYAFNARLMQLEYFDHPSC